MRFLTFALATRRYGQNVEQIELLFMAGGHTEFEVDLKLAEVKRKLCCEDCLTPLHLEQMLNSDATNCAMLITPINMHNEARSVVSEEVVTWWDWSSALDHVLLPNLDGIKRQNRFMFERVRRGGEISVCCATDWGEIGRVGISELSSTPVLCSGATWSDVTNISEEMLEYAPPSPPSEGRLKQLRQNLCKSFKDPDLEVVEDAVMSERKEIRWLVTLLVAHWTGIMDVREAQRMVATAIPALPSGVELLPQSIVMEWMTKVVIERRVPTELNEAIKSALSKFYNGREVPTTVQTEYLNKVLIMLSLMMWSTPWLLAHELMALAPLRL